MSEELRMIVEVSFNIAYLVVIWTMVGFMGARRPRIEADGQRTLAGILLAAFALLAFGDTGHVGFRVVAYALGDLEADLSIGSLRIPLVGVGALATATTVTVFYALFAELWRAGFGRRRGLVYWVLIAAAIVRLVLFVFPGNEWDRSIPPKTWSLLRNAPLVIQGVGVAVLFLRDGYRQSARMFVGMGWMIVVSFACYVPVILFVQEVPVIGMLMIPKTVAYLGAAWIGFREIFRTRKPAAPPQIAVP